MPLGIVRNLLAQPRNETRTLGARSDEAHDAPQYVQQLGQLVQAGGADEGAYFGDARIVGLRPLRDPVLFGIHAHAAKLHDREHPSVLPDALLSVQRRSPPAILDLDSQDYKQHQRRTEQQDGSAGDEVETAVEQTAQHAVLES